MRRLVTMALLIAALPAWAQADAAGAGRVFSVPVSAAELSTMRGGTDAVSATSLQGTVADNQASNVTTGGNVIGGGAFTGASGVPIVIQNSGNNVLIQNATIVNVLMK